MDSFEQYLTEGANLTWTAVEALHRGEFVQAKLMLERSRDLAITSYGMDHPITAMRSLFLSQALHGQGDYRRSRTLLDEAYKVYDPDVFQAEVSDSFENTLIEVSTMQGHFFIVEEITRSRIDRLRATGAPSDHARAIEQDKLAYLLLRQGNPQQALVLLENSVAVFERLVGDMHRDAAICYMYLHRAHRDLGNLEQAVHFADSHLKASLHLDGAEALVSLCAADNLALSECQLALQTSDAALATAGLARASAALSAMLKLGHEGANAAVLSAANLRSLSEKLRGLPGVILPADLPSVEGVALPRHCFISHSYRDGDIVKEILSVMPEGAKPIVFEPIDVSPADYVSTKLVSAVSSCDAVIVVDAEASNSSFWTAFERNLASRLGKPMFRFDRETRTFEKYVHPEMFMLLAYCCHPSDESRVAPLMRWLADDQNFVVIHDVKEHGEKAEAMFGRLDIATRTRKLDPFRKSGRGVYIIFISENCFSDASLRAHAEDQAANFPDSTVFCWIGARSEALQLSANLPAEQCFAFGADSVIDARYANRMDDLMVRLFWIFQKRGLGVPMDDLRKARPQDRA